MSIVIGHDIIFQVFDGSGFKTFACARSISINLTADLIGKSTAGSGDWKEKEKVALDWNFTCEGAVYISTPGAADTATFINIWKDFEPVNVKFYINDKGGDSLLMYGLALINSVNPSFAVNQFGAVSLSGEGTGELFTNTTFRIVGVATDTPAPGQTTLTFWFDPVPGATGYTIEVHDLTTGVITNNTGGAAPRDVPVNSLHNYAFRLRPEPGGIFGLSIYYP